MGNPFHPTIEGFFPSMSMKRKLIIQLILIFGIFGVSTILLIWHLRSMSRNQAVTSFFYRTIDNFKDIYYLSTIVQQQQEELRDGRTHDINPLVDNVLKMDSVLEKASRELEDPRVKSQCRSCHAKSGNDKWQRINPQIEKLRSELARYKLQMSRFVTGYDSGDKASMKNEAVATARQVIRRSKALEAELSTMLTHLTTKNRDWANRSGRWMMFLFLLGFVVFNVLIVRFVRQTIRPILELDRATRVIAEGRYPERLDIRTGDEVEFLAASFNKMVKNLREVTEEREKLLREARNFNTVLARRIAEVREELKAAQGQLVRSETLSAVGTLAAGVAHEISNPVHVIQGICSLALSDLDKDSDLAGDLSLIEGEAARCQKIVESLLDFARPGDSEKSLVSINRIVEESLDLMSHQRGAKSLTIETELDRELPMTLLDPGQIKQVVVNILFNAGQAMPEGGDLRVETHSIENQARDFIVLNIRDSGPGIPEELQKKIFDPFFTTKKGTDGTGLGLSISHRIVEEHGGSITVTSEVGKGSTFTIKLPIIEEEPVPVRSEEEAVL